MKWKEMTGLYRAVFLIGALGGAAYIILQLLDLIGILTGIDAIAHLCMTVCWVMLGILNWKSQRGWTILWFVLGGAHGLLAVLYLFV